MPTFKPRQFKTHNPLQHRAPSPAEYATMHHTVQSKVAMGLRNLHDQLEAELTEARDAAEKALRPLAAEVFKMEAEVRRARARLQHLRKSLGTKLDEARTLTEIKQDLLTQGDRLTAAQFEAVELEAILTNEQIGLDNARRKLRRVRARVNEVEAETAEVMAPMDEGTRRLLDAENEVIVLSTRRRTKAQPADAAVSA